MTVFPPTPPDVPVPENRKSLVAVLAVLIILVGALAGYFIYKSNQADEQISALTTQLEDAEKQIAQLQPLAEKARVLPVITHLNKHALAAGYDLLTSNRSRESLRFRFTVEAMGRQRSYAAVIDGGRFFILHGLASGDKITIESEGYDPVTVDVQ
jgi:uncharacterized membrane protein